MTNPTPLIITNKFPSWIIQDKNQPPSLAGPAGASDRLGLIYFCFRAETTIPPHFTPAPDTVASQVARQMVTEKGGGIWDKRREWPVCRVICHVSSDLCHLRGPIIVSSWHHRAPDPHPVSPANPGARGEMWKIFWVWLWTHFSSVPRLELLPGCPSCLTGASARQ